MLYDYITMVLLTIFYVIYVTIRSVGVFVNSQIADCLILSIEKQMAIGREIICINIQYTYNAYHYKYLQYFISYKLDVGFY